MTYALRDYFLITYLRTNLGETLSRFFDPDGARGCLIKRSFCDTEILRAGEARAPQTIRVSDGCKAPSSARDGDPSLPHLAFDFLQLFRAADADLVFMRLQAFHQPAAARLLPGAEPFRVGLAIGERLSAGRRR